MQSEEQAFIKPETDATAMVAAAHARATRERARLNILGLVAAFGRFAFPTPKDRTPRHADTWKDKGPHENTGAAARRMRQMERQRRKAIRRQCELDSPRCPQCGGDIERDMVDVGIGEVPAGPWGCPSCHWVDRSDTA